MTTRIPNALATLLLTGLLLAGTPAGAAELIVSAAASLTNAFQEMKPQFEAANPGTTLKFNFAASGVLFRQITEGAPVDVFVTADQETMNRADAKGLLLAGTRRDFTANTLVLVVPSANKAKVAAVADLTRPEVTAIAVGATATVPVGRYTQEALEKQELWRTLQPRFVQAESVRQVLDYVSRGEVDAGFVYQSDALVAARQVKVVQTLTGHSPITYPLAVLAESKSQETAKAFADFVAGDKGQAVLDKYGFKRIGK